MDFLGLGNLGANLLLGSIPTGRPMTPGIDLLNAGVIELRRRGHSFRPSDGIPGLWDVGGMGELTTAQVKSYAPR